MKYKCKICGLEYWGWRMINNEICIDCFRKGKK